MIVNYIDDRILITVTPKDESTADAALAKLYRDEAEVFKDTCEGVQVVLQDLIDNLSEVLEVQTELPEILELHSKLTELLAIFNKLSTLDSVYASLTEIEAVSAKLVEITTLYTNIASIQNVNDNIASIVTVASDNTVINSIYDNLIKIDTLYTNILAIISLYTNIGVLQTLNSNITELQGIYTELTKLVSVYTNLASILAVEAKLTEILAVYAKLTQITAIYNSLTQLQTLYTNLSALLNVEADLTNINIVATDIAKVIIAANNIDSINTNAVNIQAIIDAPVFAQLAEDYANKAEDSEVETGKYSALHWAAKSEGFADDSEISKLASQTARGLSEDARDLSEKWAEEEEDIAVETGKYSAKHWALKAEETVMVVTDDIAQLEDDLNQLELKQGYANAYQGSIGNPFDTLCCHTEVVPTNGARYITFRTTRPISAGYHYAIGYGLTSSLSDIGKSTSKDTWDGFLVQVNQVEFPLTNILDISAYPTAVGISLIIYEVSDTAYPYSYNNVSAASFDNYTIQVLGNTTIEDFVDKKIKEGITPVNPLIATSVNEKQFIQPVNYEVGGITISSSYSTAWEYVASTMYVRTAQGYELHLYPGDIIRFEGGYTNYDFDICARFLDGSYSGTEYANRSSDVIVTKEGYYVISVSNKPSTLMQMTPDTLGSQIKIIRNHTVGRFLPKLITESGVANVFNGSIGNAVNSTYVRTVVVPTNGSKYAMIRVNRPNSAGCFYAVAYALTSSLSDIGKVIQFNNWIGGLVNLNPNPSNKELLIDISDYPTAVGIAFTISEWNASNVNQALRASDFENYLPVITCSPAIEEIAAKIAEEYSGTDGDDSWSTDIVRRNYDRNIPLAAMCRFNRNATPSKDIQFCVIADSHGDQIAVENAVKATNGFQTLDALVHAGDIMPSYFDTNQVTQFWTRINSLQKPAYVIVGNHDVGNAKFIGLCINHQQTYDSYIKPMADNNWLSEGEYQANLPYWYTDISEYKVRIIGIYEYDQPLDLADNTYWETVAYDSTKPYIARSTAYVVGDIVRLENYTDYSFRCITDVITPADYYSSLEKLPCYRLHRGGKLIRQTQAQWFLDTLATTPANYGVVIITHNCFSDSANAVEGKFTDYWGTTPTTQNYMATDFIYDAIVSFNAGSNYSANVAMRNVPNLGDATYLNTQGGGTYAYSVSKDFATKNTGVHFLGLLSGHNHRDIVWKKGLLYQISVISANSHPASTEYTFIHRSTGNDVNDIIRDSLTCVSFAQGRIGLVKIGVNVTEKGTLRDFDVIDTTV